MKSAMQQLIDEIEKMEAFKYEPVVIGIHSKATELRDTVEREQIELAYLDGWCNSNDYHNNYKKEITDEMYYTQTYKQKEDNNE